MLTWRQRSKLKRWKKLPENLIHKVPVPPRADSRFRVTRKFVVPSGALLEMTGRGVPEKAITQILSYARNYYEKIGLSRERTVQERIKDLNRLADTASSVIVQLQELNETDFFALQGRIIEDYKCSLSNDGEELLPLIDSSYDVAADLIRNPPDSKILRSNEYHSADQRRLFVEQVCNVLVDFQIEILPSKNSVPSLCLRILYDLINIPSKDIEALVRSDIRNFLSSQEG